MRRGQVSRTALNVAGSIVTLGAAPGWRERLPAGLAELSEELLLASDQYPFSRQSLRLAKRPGAVRLARLGERFQPGTFTGLGKRKIFMNDQVVAAMAAGATQVLVVGAGFDALCLRLAPDYPAVRFVEIDHPDTSRVKRRAVEQLGQPDNMTLIAVDLGRRKLSRVLAECDVWNTSARSVVVAEGLLYYLSRADVRQLFAQLAESAGTGSRVAFSHLFDPYSYRLARVALRVAGEPWLSASSTEDLPDYLGPGWQIIEARPGRRYRDLEGLAVAESS
jgi:methyltransferase (TIGR00027 family)